MSALVDRLKTARRLGMQRILDVVLYRMWVRSGLAERYLPIGSEDRAPPALPESLRPVVRYSHRHGELLGEADRLLAGHMRFFFRHERHVGSPPDWFLDPFADKRISVSHKHWSSVPDFLPEVGDMKCIWEPSRFDWILVLVRAYLETNAKKYLTTANNWLANWHKANPVNCGPNWKCGQEASLRLLTLLLAYRLLGRHEEQNAALSAFLYDHCRRIAPTTRYAVAQQNNHATSEAAALLVGGAWLMKFGSKAEHSKSGGIWQAKGRRLLDEVVPRLILEDGTFSQYSTTYHRLMLDTLSHCELWRQCLGLPRFSERFYERARQAVIWLAAMVDLETGDAPNLGPNDGAWPLRLSDGDFRDFRPAVELGSAVFFERSWYGPGGWAEPLRWLELEVGTVESRSRDRATEDFPCGGFAILRSASRKASALVRYPRSTFRPGHADALHVDLWANGLNLLRDGGSYSYAVMSELHDYFRGVASHNTVQFDDREPMPVLGRFLFGSWVEAERVSMEEIGQGDRLVWEAAYTDTWGARHSRRIEVLEETLRIIDTLTGVWSRAVLRWRLAPELCWSPTPLGVASVVCQLEVDSPVAPARRDVVEGWESRYYMERSSLPVLEVEWSRPREGYVEARTTVKLIDRA